MTLIINFISKPPPSPEDVRWSLVEQGYESTIEKVDLKQLLSGRKYLFESSAMIGNLSKNSTLKFSVTNKVGESERNFTLFVFSNDAQEINLTYKFTIMEVTPCQSSLLLLVVVLLFFILVFL